MKKLVGIIFFAIILLILFLNINVHAATGRVVIYYNDINQHPVGQKVSYDTCTIGTNYKGTAPSISGYTYMPNESETSTYCDEGDNIIAFVYQTKGNKKEGTVNVSCYDTKGNKLNKCTDGRSGTPGVNGYKFVRVEGANNGKFIEGAVNVKFIYESVGGNLVEETKPQTELVKQEPKKEEPVKASNNNNTVTTKKIVTKTNTVASTNDTKKEEVKEENKEIVKEDNNIQRSITVVDHTNNNTGKYIVLGGIFSSIILVGFVIKYSLFK